MHQFLKEYLEVHGYWVLFIWTFLEGEAGLIFAGFLAFQGYMNVVGVIFTAFAGAFSGDQFYFYVGRRHGPQLLRLSTMIVRKFRKAMRLIEKYGTFVAFISRYTYGFRIILPIVIGMTTFPVTRFLWINLISAFSWAIIFSMAGYLFGISATYIVGNVSRYEQYLMLVLAGLVVVIWLSHFAYASWRIIPAKRRLRRMKAHRLDKTAHSEDKSANHYS